ncbi:MULTISPECIES: hypothetical protein [Acidobacteriaceae]|uniref:hypothetical protein n=1 Tax=Acidobacteriaceae TaxID=204434 RepID=UPI00131D5074|nr:MULTISPECIES: hypothetical protein [Acidobacteriaceae]MDW5266182.1 hypothetical protein [Edaphobacter sp.]
MNGSIASSAKKVIRGCSRLLLWVGAAVFLIGGKFLYEIQHVKFAKAEAEGMFGGLLLMLLGAGMGIKTKTSSFKAEKASDRLAGD